jgi:DNA repair exonuclease SbcCD ATPase subunit
MKKVWISEVALSGFGVYGEEQTFIFAEGMNTLIGDNEAGKSTLATGICAILFGLPTSIDPVAYGSQRYRSWHKPEPFAGRMLLETDGMRYEVVRDFASHRIKVREISTQTRREIVRGVHNPRASRPNVSYLAFLRRITGVETAELFRQIYFVQQPLPGQSSFSKDLQQLLSGGGHYESTRDLLRTRLKDLTRNPHHYDTQMNPGRKDQQIEEFQAQLAGLISSIEQSQGSLAEMESIATELEAKQSALADAKRSLESLRSQRVALDGLAKLQKQVDDATELRRRLSRARQQIDELRGLLRGVQMQLSPEETLSRERDRLATMARTLAGQQDALPGADRVTLRLESEHSDLLDRRDRWRSTESRLEALDEGLREALGCTDLRPVNSALLLEELANISALINSHRPDLKPLFTGAILAALILLLRGARLPDPRYLWPSLCVLAGALASVAEFVTFRMRKRRRTREILDQFDLHPDLDPATLKELAVAEQEYRQLVSAKPVASGDEIACALKDSEARLVQWRDLSQRHQALREREKQLLGQLESHSFALTEVVKAHGLTGAEELEAKLHLADEDYFYARRALEEYVLERRELPSAQTIEENGVDSLIAVITDSEQALSQDAVALEGQLRDLLSRQARLQGNHPANIAQAEEHRAEVEGRCRGLLLEARSYGLALKELDAAVREFHDQYRCQISELVQTHYRAITGTEREVLCDDEFRIRLREPEGMELDPAQLSQGARDQLYIALRLALAEFMSPRSSFPLVFDDPFLTSDKDRLEKIRASLDAAGRQIILLSHNSVFSSWGRSVSKGIL